MVLFILLLVLIGLVIGYLARLLLPGRDPLGLWGTLAVGVAGTLISGFIGRAWFGADGNFGSLLLALVVTMLLLWVIRQVGGRRPA
jgi:uncharacterized membrane protein YeaQ/YmgE (transglycosylase-associated protein family)